MAGAAAAAAQLNGTGVFGSGIWPWTEAPRALYHACASIYANQTYARPHGYKAAMSRRADTTCFDGEIARRDMASCHITVISPLDTVQH